MTKMKDVEQCIQDINRLSSFIDSQRIRGINYNHSRKFSKICEEIKGEILDEYTQNSEKKESVSEEKPEIYNSNLGE